MRSQCPDAELRARSNVTVFCGGFTCYAVAGVRTCLANAAVIANNDTTHQKYISRPMFNLLVKVNTHTHTANRRQHIDPLVEA